MMDATSTATARWEGDTVTGNGVMSSESGVLREQPYTWPARIGEAGGTTPEELLAAAQAGCFAMALSFGMTMAGHAPRSLDVRAECSFGAIGDDFGITGMRLEVVADAPGLELIQLAELAAATKASCPVSRALSGIEISVDARLA